ncbi:MAG: magnesium transporter [Candidatus Thorarchaeota archaeon]
MDTQDTKGRIIKETFPSEMVSIVGDIFAGIVLTFLILPFKSVLVLLIIIPALLSLRGNITSPFIARTARDLIIGEFNVKSWIENVLATYLLSIVTALIIGLFSLLLDLLFFKYFLLPFEKLIYIPILSIFFTLSITIPISTTLNYIIFIYGLNPNNIVNPVMTAIGDFAMVVCFYLTLLLLGVP